MRVGLINVTNLTRVRETFRPGWRTFISVTFLLSVFFWWAIVHRLKSLSPLVDDETFRARTLILATATLIPLLAALFRRGDFARLFFAAATVFNIATLTLILLASLSLSSPVALQDGTAVFFAILGVLFVFAIYAKQLIQPCYLLLVSLMPFGRWKAFRTQVVCCLRLWSGEWKGVVESQVGAGEKPYLTPGVRRRLAVGWLSFAFGLLIFGLAFFGLLNDAFLPAVFRLELSRAWHMLATFHLPAPGESQVTFWSAAAQVTYVMSVFFFGLVFFFVFGFFWTQWRRENVPVYRVPLLQHMTPSDLLLLRSFNDDVKYVSRPKSAWTIIFKMYRWSYTFEQLIVNRLKYLGRVRLIDVAQEREGLLDEWGLRHVGRVVGRDRLQKFLSSVFPAVWRRLPAQGGVRYYIEAEQGKETWREEIEKAMALARVIVVVLGTTPSLMWEVCRIEQLGLSGKTLFVMPPLIRKKNYRARWQQFADFVCESRACDERLLKKVNPKRVLAAVVRDDSLVIMTGKASSQTFYESALDVATILAVNDPAQSGKMIQKFLK